MIRVARAALFAVLPAELLVVVLLVSGAPIPAPVTAAAELAVAAVLVLESVAVARLIMAERRAGAGRWAAVRGGVRRLVPEPVARIVGFDTKGMVSLVLWVARRRHGVPSGATAIPYAREQAAMLLALLFVMVVETVAVELLLRALDVPDGLRLTVLALDVYGILVGTAVGAAYATRPHVVSGRELRVRHGAFFDLRIPRSLIGSVRLARNYDERGMIAVRDGRLAVAVASQTNVVVELTEPVTAVRPLGGRSEAATVRFFADDPAAAVAALTAPAGAGDGAAPAPASAPAPSGKRSGPARR